MRLITSEIEIHGDQIESKKRQLKKKLFKKKLIWKSLKQTAINWNLYLGGVIRPEEAIEIYHYQVYEGQERKERQTFRKQQKIHKVLRDTFVSAQKA